MKALGRRTGSTRTDDQTALAPFWEGSASVHWNQAANQMAERRHLSMSQSARLFATLNIAMADTSVTIWTAKRFYGSVATEVTWRPVTAIPLAESDGNPDTVPDPDWLPLMTTPSHPEYPAGHPSLNGAAATVLLRHFNDRQTFTLTTVGQPSRTVHQHLAGACRREQRTYLGRHALSEHGRRQRCHGRGHRQVRGSERDAAAGGPVSVAASGAHCGRRGYGSEPTRGQPCSQATVEICSADPVPRPSPK